MAFDVSKLKTGDVLTLVNGHTYRVDQRRLRAEREHYIVYLGDYTEIWLYKNGRHVRDNDYDLKLVNGKPYHSLEIHEPKRTALTCYLRESV